LSNGKLSSVKTLDIFSEVVSKIIGFSSRLDSQALYLFVLPAGAALIAVGSPPSNNRGSDVDCVRKEF
jgi:hypothetical protein